MRLIDADRLKINLYHNKKVVLNDDLVKCIDYTETAYDIDKVIKELEKESFTTTDTVCGGIFKAIRLSSAIEIVKQGGVSDDVCKWRIVDRPNNLPIYNTSCGKIRLQYVTGVDIYCNGCGKKIKIVDR